MQYARAIPPERDVSLEALIMNADRKLGEFGSEDRGVMFNRALDSANVVSWKRAATVSKDCQVSHATASGWLLGSLPRDAKALLRVRDLYNIDIDEWINGSTRSATASLSGKKIARLSGILRGYENENNVRLTDDQFSKLMVMLYEEESKTEFLLDFANVLK